MILLRFFEIRLLVDVKAKHFFWYRIVGRETELGRRNIRFGDNFDWLGGHYANQENPEVSLRGSWMYNTVQYCHVLY